MPFLSPVQREKFPSLLIQIGIIIVLILVFREFVLNAQANIQRLGLKAGFSFLGSQAGFEISQKIIEFGRGSTYLTAVIVAILNTLIVSLVGIFLCTVIGLIVAFSRFSSNPVIAFLAGLYVEVFRNIPLLLQIFFWYFGVVGSLPAVRQSFSLGPIFLNNRGLFIPVMDMTTWGWLVLIVDMAAIIAIIYLSLRNYSRYGRITKKSGYLIGFSILLPLVLHLLPGNIGVWNVPSLKGFSFTGGMTISPEFVAMAVALSIYNSTFMSEIFRSGINSVPKGQFEAAETVGLTGARANLLIVLPQALRVSIPPSGGQFQVIVKASSLSAAVAYPDIMHIIGGTMLSITNQALECMAIVALSYLLINLLVTLALNIYNNATMRRGGR